MLENLDKIMHLPFNFDACPMHSPSGFVPLTHQNLSACALFCLNSLAKVNTQLLIYKYTSNTACKFEYFYNNTGGTHLLLIREPSTIKLSSRSPIISVVLSPRRRSSPLFLKLPNMISLALHSAMTVFSLASMSFSFTADIQISYNSN